MTFMDFVFECRWIFLSMAIGGGIGLIILFILEISYMMNSFLAFGALQRPFAKKQEWLTLISSLSFILGWIFFIVGFFRG
jgi:hypothetical protein